MAPGRRLQTSDGNRTLFVYKIYRTIPTVPDRAVYGARPDIVRCLTSAKNIEKSLNKSADARPGTGRSFMSRTATGEKRRVFCRCTYCIYIDISLLKIKNINTNIYISLQQLRMINMQQTSTIEIFAVLSKCGFHHPVSLEK